MIITFSKGSSIKHPILTYTINNQLYVNLSQNTFNLNMCFMC